MSKFFINRPIFAIVIAIVITLVGLISMMNLPVARYPQISPPTVQVNTAYTGATAQVVNDTVASVIETQIVGVQDMDYMTSNSSSNGSYSLTVQFNQGTDADMDTVNTQNRVQAALAQLPSEVQAVGVTTTKSSGDMALIFSLSSPNGTYDATFLKNYGTNYMMDTIKSIKGVGSVQEFGSDYSMRIWLDPAKMQKLGVTISEVTAAIKGQNLQAAAGTVGKNPTNGEQAFQYPIKIDGRLVTPEQFGNIAILDTNFKNVGTSINQPAPVITANRKWHYLMNPQFNSAGGSVDKPCFTLIARMDKMPPYLIEASREGDLPSFIKMFSGGLVYEIYDTDTDVMKKIKEFMAMYGISDIKMRMLTIPELKRIMGFPEDYMLIGTKAEQKKYIGNAVEVNMARVLCEALCKILVTTQRKVA